MMAMAAPCTLRCPIWSVMRPSSAAMTGKAAKGRAESPTAAMVSRIRPVVEVLRK
ncbi:hypothetical protein ACFSLT_12010 [Novosphingobium resinovorum]